MFRYLVLAALFFILSPGNFLRLPRNGSKRMVAFVHAVVFVVAYYLSEKLAEMLNVKLPEGFQNTLSTPNRVPAKPQNPAVAEFSGYYMECISTKDRKDAEYRTNGDNTARFRELDRMQGQACDRANDANNKLKSMNIPASWW